MKVELAAQRSAPIRPQGFGSTTRRWPRPILRPSHRLIIYPSRRWFDPLGSKPRWALPSAVGFYPPGSNFVVGLCLPPLGYNLHRWALSLWHLLRRRGGLSSSFVVLIVLNPSFGWYHHCWCSALRLGLLGKGLRCVMCRRWVGGMRAC